jgi:DNA-binding winged helix-turn-helix (wHTH) protein
MSRDVAVIAFGPFRLDRIRGRLLRGEADVPLRSKTFAVLEYLALRPGRLVYKEELLDALWPATHVTSSVLAGCIRELRRALGDDARAARFIETAYRRGYRFVATERPRGAASAQAVSLGRSMRRALGLRESEIVELARRFAEAVARLARRGDRAVRRKRRRAG